MSVEMGWLIGAVGFVLGWVCGWAWCRLGKSGPKPPIERWQPPVKREQP